MVDLLPPVYFVGMSGMGMGPFALHLHLRGWKVTGHDDHWRPDMRQTLTAAGVVLHDGKELPPETTTVVYTPACPPDHRLLEEARRRKLPCMTRTQALAKLYASHKLIAVTGSHGKTTTTAMLITALRQRGLHCNYLLGGLFADPACLPTAVSEERLFVAEVDESDGTFVDLEPAMTIIVNSDWDHPSHYADRASNERAFAKLARRTTGPVLIPWDDPLRLQLGDVDRLVTFGSKGDYCGLLMHETLEKLFLGLNGRFPGTVATVRAAGAFNAQNALAALAAADLLAGGSPRDSLSAFPGCARRQQRLLTTPNEHVMHDYAHHPAEVAAILAAARQWWRGWRLEVVFQPHRYTRTAAFARGFAQVLVEADHLYLVPTYGADEHTLLPRGTADAIGQNFPPERFTLAPAPRLLLEKLLDEPPAEKRALLFIGAGDIEEMARTYVQRRGEQPLAPAQPVRRRDWWKQVAARVGDETELCTDEPLANKTTLRVGGNARYYAEPADRHDLQRLLVGAREAGVPVFCMGRGANLIVLDEGFDGLVIRLRHRSWQRLVPRGPQRCWAGAGVRLKELAAMAVRERWEGFSFLDGIPGTIGGSLRMNAGAMGAWIGDRVMSVEIMTLAGELLVRRREELTPGYRDCPELHDAIVLGAEMRAAGEAPSAYLRQQMEAYAAQRKQSQPREPSAGCIFRNPEGDYAGRLVEAAGLKGHRIGDAEVSHTHANFIINVGRARASDVLTLVREARSLVRAQAGVLLQPEALLLGGDWKEVLGT